MSDAERIELQAMRQAMSTLASFSYSSGGRHNKEKMITLARETCDKFGVPYGGGRQLNTGVPQQT